MSSLSRINSTILSLILKQTFLCKSFTIKLTFEAVAAKFNFRPTVAASDRWTAAVNESCFLALSRLFGRSVSQLVSRWTDWLSRSSWGSSDFQLLAGGLIDWCAYQLQDYARVTSLSLLLSSNSIMVNDVEWREYFRETSSSFYLPLFSRRRRHRRCCPYYTFITASTLSDWTQFQESRSGRLREGTWWPGKLIESTAYSSKLNLVS